MTWNRGAKTMRQQKKERPARMRLRHTAKRDPSPRQSAFSPIDQFRFEDVTIRMGKRGHPKWSRSKTKVAKTPTQTQG